MALSVNSSNVLLGNSVPVSSYPFSLAGWFRVPDVSYYLSLAGFKDSGTGAVYEIFFAGHSGSKSAGVYTFVTSGVSAQSTSPMIPGQWHHVVAIFSSDVYRKIILDGGNSAINTASRAFVTSDTFYMGNRNTSALVDVAEFSVIKASVSDSQAAALAGGCPVLSSSLSSDVVAHYDFIRQKNRPALGPTATSAAAPTVVDHPSVMLSSGGRSTVMPLRRRGPFRIEQGLFRSLSEEQGQHALAGVVSNSTILSGEVSS